MKQISEDGKTRIQKKITEIEMICDEEGCDPKAIVMELLGESGPMGGGETPPMDESDDDFDVNYGGVEEDHEKKDKGDKGDKDKKKLVAIALLKKKMGKGDE